MNNDWVNQLDILASNRKLSAKEIEKALRSQLEKIFTEVLSNESKDTN